jgi:hypothetical protein
MLITKEDDSFFVAGSKGSELIDDFIEELGVAI